MSASQAALAAPGSTRQQKSQRGPSWGHGEPQENLGDAAAAATATWAHKVAVGARNSQRIRCRRWVAAQTHVPSPVPAPLLRGRGRHMSPQRPGQQEAVSTPAESCVRCSGLILLPRFCGNVASVVTSGPSFSCRLLGADQAAPSIGRNNLRLLLPAAPEPRRVGKQPL